MEHSGPAHFETKKLLHFHPEAPGERVIVTPGASGPRIPPGGLAAAVAALYLPLVIPSFTHVHAPQERPWYPLCPGSSLCLASRSPAAPSPTPTSTQLGQREPIVPTRTGPCPAARLRDGCLMPVSPPPVPMLSHPPPPPGGGVQLPLTG